MANYIPGLVDYIPQIQSFQPDYNFLGNVMQTRQSRYDQSYQQVSSMYGSLLNSPMLRDSNIKRRDEFFKSIDSDIKKISGMDLSLQQNTDAAMKIFQPFYDDKNMVNDMVKTKKAYGQLTKADMLKGCTDPEKCGGQYWEPGVNEIKYKMEEFKNVTDDEALGFEIPSFTPYYNWQKDAVKLAKDANLNVTMQQDTGKWIVTNKNGQLIEGGLYGLFKNAYGNDPRVAANYNTSSYVTRKDYARQNAMVHGSEEAAEQAYITNTLTDYKSKMNSVKQPIADTQNNLKGRMGQIERDQETSGVLPGELSILQDVVAKYDSIKKVNDSLEQVDDVVNNQDLNDIKALRHKADAARAFMLQDSDFTGMAKILSLKDADYKIDANPYAMASHTSSLALRNSMTMAGVNHANSLDLLSAHLNKDMSLAKFKHLLTNGLLDKDNVVGKPLMTETYSVGDLNKDNPKGLYERNQTLAFETKATAQSKDTAFMYDLFQRAKQANQNHPETGPSVYLKNTFGKNWESISTPEDMVKALAQKKLSVNDAFSNSIKELDQTANPTGDTQWAKSYLTSRGKDIEAIKQHNDAYVSIVDFTLKNNKRVVSDIVKQGAVKGQESYKDADLLLEDGVVIDDEKPSGKFLASYVYRHNPKVLTKDANGEYIDQSALNGEIKKGMAAYETLKDKFYDQYNHTKGISYDSAAGLPSGSMRMSYPLQYKDVNAAKPNSPAFSRAKDIMEDITSSENYDVVLGKPTAENIEAGSQETLKAFVSGELQSDLRNAHLYKKPLLFNYTESGIAGNDPNKSAINIQLSGNELKKYVGSDKNPGPLYNYKDQLADGISLVYNSKEVQTATSQAMGPTPLELTYKLRGKTYDSFKYAGKAEVNYDNDNNKYMLNFTSLEFDQSSGTWVTSHSIPTPIDGKAEEIDANIVNILDQRQKANLELEAKWKAANRVKQIANN